MRSVAFTQRRTREGRRLPLVFLVKARRDGWVEAYLPTRPNLSTGWLKAANGAPAQPASSF